MYFLGCWIIYNRRKEASPPSPTTAEKPPVHSTPRDSRTVNPTPPAESVVPEVPPPSTPNQTTCIPSHTTISHPPIIRFADTNNNFSPTVPVIDIPVRTHPSIPSCPDEDLQEVILHDPPSTNVEPPSPPPPRSFLGSFSSFLSNVLRK